MDFRNVRDTNRGLPRPRDFQNDPNRNRGSNFRTLPCKHWQKGSCKKGDKCTFLHLNGSSTEDRRTPQNPPAASSSPIAHGTNNPHRSPPEKIPTRACTMFITKRRCNYGDSCKFSHDPDFKPDPLQMEATQPLDDLKMVLRNFERTQQFRFIEQFEKFVETSLKALELPDRDLQSKAISCLSEHDNGGREVVRYIAEAMGNLSPPFDGMAFDKHVVPFMKLVVHDVFTRTCIEKNLLYLIKALYGDGKRGDRLLTRIIDLLEPIMESTTNIEDGSVQGHCLLVCKLFHHIVQYNADASSQPELMMHHARLLVLSNGIRTTTPNTRKIEKSLSEISAYLFPAVTTDKAESTHKASSFTAPGQELPVGFVLDLPGQLSRSGIRHDNDSHLIDHIRILPTMGEFNSNRPEYLPINDMRAPHFLEGPARLFDIHFRLLREDMIGPMRIAVNMIVSELQSSRVTDPQFSARFDHHRNSALASTRIYFDVTVDSAKFDKKMGLVFGLGFQQPKRFRSLAPKNRINHWKIISSLEANSLLCLVSPQLDLQCFFTVVKKDESLLGRDENRCFIEVVLADEKATINDSTREKLLLALTSKRQKAHNMILVEFTGVLLMSYKAILENLQARSRHPYLPFSNLVCPAASDLNPCAGPCSTVTVQPPLYAMSDGFEYDLTILKASKTTDELRLSPDASPDDKELLAKLEMETTLDAGQCKGLMIGLTRELALIQGPPGTGKTHLGVELMKVLLHNKTKLRLGPIICVCYTNHALDQFLEHLLVITKSIVRIGSRSKSETLQNYNLHDLVYQQGALLKSGTERGMEGRLHSKLSELEINATELCGSLRDQSTTKWSHISDFLKVNYRHHYEQLCSAVDNEGFQTVGAKGGNFFAYWMHCKDIHNQHLYQQLYGIQSHTRGPTAPRPLEQLLEPTVDIWTFSRHERRMLLDFWTQQIREVWIDKLNIRAEDHIETIQELDNLHSEYRRRVLVNADVIGLTTTGLARYAGLLDRVKSKTLICEEAGEVLESHLLTALLPSIEHCILIGDHMQLRPKASNYDLSVEKPRGVKHNLDVSLFERLCVGGIPSTSKENFRLPLAQLTVQRRMRPEIADLVRIPLYPKLQDHSCVSEYPAVEGMYHSLYWFDHSIYEDGSGPLDLKETSHSNEYEVQMVTQLVAHLSKQEGYENGDVAVITPYVGQLRKLRDALGNTYSVQLSERDTEEIAALDDVHDTDERFLEAPKRQKLTDTVRIATVDNFQGEEAKIIVVSLVRSNDKGQVGFLKTPNRINVLLRHYLIYSISNSSRAKHGMYIIGDARCAEKVEMWGEVISILRDREQLGPVLRLRCSRHEESVMNVSKPKDFEMVSPEGGCKEPCGTRLQCGHACDYLCHAEVRHRIATCRKPCERGRPSCGHSCPKGCSEPCGECKVLVKNVPLACGHLLPSIECWLSQNLSNPRARCAVRVIRTLPRCGHDAEMFCGDNPQLIRCQQECGGYIDCFHRTCRNPCSDCAEINHENGARTHAPCSQLCDKNFKTCSHRCRRPCHPAADNECGSCNQPCQMSCVHSQCKGVCGQYCVPCAEPCTWQCPHMGRCNMPCGAPCDRLPCNERCSLLLKCGHRCPSLCGERCPLKEFCQECGSVDKMDAIVDFIECPTYKEVDVTHDPIVVLPCQHFYTVSFLDDLMDIYKVYRCGSDGTFKEAIPNDGMTLEAKHCPQCRMPISQVQRYNRVIKRFTLDNMLLSVMIHSQKRYVNVQNKLSKMESSLHGGRDAEIAKLIPVFNSRQKQPIRDRNLGTVTTWMQQFNDIRRDLSEYIKNVHERNQPHMKVFEMSIAAQSRLRSNNGDAGVAEPVLPQLDVPSPDIKFRLLGNLLELRLNILESQERMHFAARFSALSGCQDESNLLRKLTREKCQPKRKAAKDLLRECEERRYPGPAIEILLHEMELIRLQFYPSTESALNGILRCEAKDILAQCEHYLQKYPICKKYQPAVDRARKALERSGPFYEAVTPEEIRMVVIASQNELRGTGHWYRCPNDHPFSINECGMAMQRARCPECGEIVGGENHRSVDGVTEARDFDEFLRR